MKNNSLKDCTNFSMPQGACLYVFTWPTRQKCIFTHQVHVIALQPCFPGQVKASLAFFLNNAPPISLHPGSLPQWHGLASD